MARTIAYPHALSVPRPVLLAAAEKRVALGLGAAVLVFLAVATWDIRLPGVYYDELIQIDPALAFVRGGLPSVVSWVPTSQVSVRGHPLPLMIMPYIGAIKTVLYAPLAAVFGVTPESVRLFTVALGAGGLVATFLFTRRVFGAAVALVTSALLASDPSFVFYSRLDFGPTVLMMLTKMLGLWLLAAWWHTGRDRWLLAGSFAFGLGVYDKADFVWVIAAVLGAAALVAPARVLSRRGCLSPRRLVVASLGFGLGAWPLALYNLRLSALGTLGALQDLATNERDAPGFLAQLGQRLGVLVNLLQGQVAPVTRPLGGEVWHAPLLPALVAASVAVIVLPPGRRRLGPLARPAAFVTLAGLLVILAAALTPHATGGHHVILAYPFPHIAVAAVLVGLARQAAKPVLVPGLTLLVVGVNAATSVSALSGLEASGGEGLWSDSIYRLTDTLLAQPDAPTVALDWGIHFNIVGLSQGRLASTDLWFPLTSPAGMSSQELQALVRRPSVRYVLHAPEATRFPQARQRFFDAVDQAGLHATLQTALATRQGDPLFEIYTVD